MLPQSSFWQDGGDRLTAREQAMGMIDDFSQLRMPFLEPKRKRKPIEIEITFTPEFDK